MSKLGKMSKRTHDADFLIPYKKKFYRANDSLSAEENALLAQLPWHLHRRILKKTRKEKEELENRIRVVERMIQEKSAWPEEPRQRLRNHLAELQSYYESSFTCFVSAFIKTYELLLSDFNESNRVLMDAPIDSTDCRSVQEWIDRNSRTGIYCALQVVMRECRSKGWEPELRLDTAVGEIVFYCEICQ
jgi:hypothetical protein